MGVRLYKVESITLNDTPLFNLWHPPQDILNLLPIKEQLNKYDEGYVLITKNDIEKALKSTSYKGTIEVLQTMLKDVGLDNDDVNYLCF